jgi:putative flavoprotein involved in K+ transport
MNMDEAMDVVVIGAGQAGLAVSYLLTQEGVDHVVLERGRIGETWRSQRWDSFHLNTPNWSNRLPGMEFEPDAPDAFGHRDELVSFFEGYARFFGAPVREHTPVTSLERLSTGGYQVQTGQESLQARAVVIASGSMCRPRQPAIAQNLADDITCLTAGSYKNPETLPEGAVVVVGSGQSGCQITEDLLAAGRRVYLCTSRVGRLPRRYRGREVLVWWREMGIMDVRVDELENPAVQFAAQPQISGADGGRTLSLQLLAQDGATLLGRALDVDGHVLKLGRDLMECIQFADEKARAFKADIDAFIQREGIDAPEPEPDPGEPPLPDLGGSDLLERLDLHWLKVDVFDERGHPRHRDGVTSSPGLYCIGFPWLSKRKSGILWGIPEDAARIVEHIRT